MQNVSPMLWMENVLHKMFRLFRLKLSHQTFNVADYKDELRPLSLGKSQDK
jgi:hypothetical protein